MIAVGKITKPHGIRGDLKAECFMDSPDCFIKIKRIFIEGDSKSYEVKKASAHKDGVLFHLTGVEEMNSAELLRGKILYCEEDDMPKPTNGRYYISDVIGCTVYAGDTVYGRIIDILQYGSADVIVLSDKGKHRSFPWIKRLNASVNVDAKLFRVDENVIKEVLLDED